MNTTEPGDGGAVKTADQWRATVAPDMRKVIPSGAYPRFRA